MVKVLVKGPLKKVFGFKEFSLEGGKRCEVLKDVSERLGVEILEVSGKIFMRTQINGKDVKFRISVFYNGKNIEVDKVDEIREGTLEIITPIGGG